MNCKNEKGEKMKIKSDLQMLLYLERIEQKTVAEVLGCNQSTISRWLKNPTVKNREKIMDAIKIIKGGADHEQND